MVQVIVLHDEIVPAHLHAHARAVVDVVVSGGVVHAVHADAAGVLVEDTHVVDVIVLRDVPRPGERLAVSTTQADAVATGVADFVVRKPHVLPIAHANAAAIECAHLSDDAAFHEAVLCALKGDRAAVAASKCEAADRDLLRTGLYFEEAVECGNTNFSSAHITWRPEVQRAGMLVVKPLTRCVEFFEGVLKVIAVVRVQVVAAVLLQREHACLRIERDHRLDEIPPAVLREDVEFHVLGMRPLAHIFGLHIDRAFPQMALRCAAGWKLRHKGPAAIERVLHIEVRVARQNLPLAVAEELFWDETLWQQLGDIRFDNLALMLFPAGDDRGADERAAHPGEGQVGILRFELNRLRQVRRACWQKNCRRGIVPGYAGFTNLIESLGQREGRGDPHLQGMSGGKDGRSEREKQRTGQEHGCAAIRHAARRANACCGRELAWGRQIWGGRGRIKDEALRPCHAAPSC